MRVYLDNAATTPIRKEVVEAMLPYMNEHFGNPSSLHAEGRKARAAIEAARKTVAKCIGASIGEIFFTSGGTEAHNMALKGAIQNLGVKRVITSPIEHHCILHPLNRMLKEYDANVTFLNVDKLGRPDMDQLKRELETSDVKTMVCLMHGNNEIGTMIDLNFVSELCEKHNALFHSDTVQTVGHFPIDVSKTNISFLVGAGHKIHGPKGVGFIYINGDNVVNPYIDGGSQERNMRGGTENVYGIIGYARALELMLENLDEERAYIEQLRKQLRDGLESIIPNIQFNGDIDGDALYTVLSAAFPPSPKNEMLLLSLDIAGISTSGGSACSSGAESASHVLEAIKGDPDYKTIRFSFSKYNTAEEVDFALTELKRLFPS